MFFHVWHLLVLIFIINTIHLAYGFSPILRYYYNQSYAYNQHPYHIIMQGAVDVVNSSTSVPQLETFCRTPDCTTYIIAHGFISSGSEDWVVRMKDELLKNNKKANVLVIHWDSDWVALSLNLGYVDAVKRIDPVALLVSRVLNNFVKYGYLHKVDGLLNVHCIGHSLGAHMCGFIGHRMLSHNLKLKRISGLDPASPCFKDYQWPQRLGRNDADYVDVIHTSKNFGFYTPLGHSDYYPGGGSSQQACSSTFEATSTISVIGCPSNILSSGTKSYEEEQVGSHIENVANISSNIDARSYSTCSHSMATLYYIESINVKPKACKFDAFANPFDQLSKGLRSHCKINTMGFHSEKDTPAEYLWYTYYLYATMTAPYCYGPLKTSEASETPTSRLVFTYCEPIYTKLFTAKNKQTENGTAVNLINKNTVLDGFCKNSTSCTNYFLIHGFNEDSSSSSSWMKRMKNELFAKLGDNINVFIVDWSVIPGIFNCYNMSPIVACTSANDPLNDYEKAMKSLAIVNSHLKLMISRLYEFDYLTVSKVASSNELIANIHCIGQGMGAHLCGLVGKSIIAKENIKLKRITGLDPSGPCFDNYDDKNKLTMKDAYYVDIIHTSHTLGTQAKLGHSDFYPSDYDRSKNQPGCQSDSTTDKQITACGKTFTSKPTLSCNYNRANEYFIESLSRECKFNTVYDCTDACTRFCDCNCDGPVTWGACICNLNMAYCLNRAGQLMGFHSMQINQQQQFKFLTHVNSTMKPFC